MSADEHQTRAQRFANVVKPLIEEAGYTGYGASARLSRETGMSDTTISMMLKGRRIPDPMHFEPLAKALGVPVMDLFVAAKLVSASTLHEPPTPPVRSPITIDEAADELGFTDPAVRELFAGMVERLWTLQSDTTTTPDEGADGAGGGVAAER
ncbi:helix-turn-helix domain-containing protein [Streptomyces roseifaciens]